VPPERLSILRRAFDETMKDPLFLDDAKRMQADILPSTGEQVTSVVKEALAFPPDVVDLLKDALRQPTP
jgi:hypothetical protein